MKNLIVLVLALVAVVPSSGRAQNEPNLHAQVMERLKLTRCQIEDVALPATEALANALERREALKVPVTLAGEKLTLDLRPHSLRSEKFKLLVQKAGGAILEEPAPPPGTWRGSVTGKPGSAVTASIMEGAFRASIRLADGSSWTMQPVKSLFAAARLPTHVVYENADLLGVPGTCAARGANLAGPGAAANAEAQIGFQPAGAPIPDEVSFAQIAFDADLEFFQLNGSSVAATMADIESILNAVDAIYIRDTGIAYQLTTILVRTADPDPYSSTDPDTLLAQLNTEWTFNQILKPRDIVHLMTGKNLDGNVVGIADLGVVCAVAGRAYGLSQSRFASSFAGRVSVTAHELGHNWGACHCNDCISPTPADCDIMQSEVPSNPSLGFGAFSSAQIVNYRNTWGWLCLQSSDVFVNAGAIPPFIGTRLSPVKTVTDGRNAVPTRGRILIRGPNNYRETLQIDRSMSLMAVGGPITIGQ